MKSVQFTINSTMRSKHLFCIATKESKLFSNDQVYLKPKPWSTKQQFRGTYNFFVFNTERFAWDGGIERIWKNTRNGRITKENFKKLSWNDVGCFQQVAVKTLRSTFMFHLGLSIGLSWVACATILYYQIEASWQDTGIFIILKTFQNCF